MQLSESGTSGSRGTQSHATHHGHCRQVPPADIILCPLAEFIEDRDTPNTLAYEAAHHGVTIYER